MELKQVATVKSGGRVEVVFPELTVGQVVEVVVRSNGTSASRESAANRFGFAQNQIWMSEDFDAPLEDFREYM